MSVSYLLTKEYTIFCTKKIYFKKIITFSICGAIILVYGLLFLIIGLFEGKGAIDYSIPIIISSICFIIYLSIYFALKYKKIVKTLDFPPKECTLNFKENVVEFQEDKIYSFSYKEIKNVFYDKKYCIIFVDNYFIPISINVVNDDFLNILKKNNIRNNIKL